MKPKFLEKIFDSFTNYPDQIALICGNQSLTYSELLTRAKELNKLLVDSGIEPGDRY